LQFDRPEHLVAGCLIVVPVKSLLGPVSSQVGSQRCRQRTEEKHQHTGYWQYQNDRSPTEVAAP
jgi:hypothetical protein